MSEWQPIETAPKDGRHIIGWFGDSDEKYAESVFWFDVAGRQAWLWTRDCDEPELPPTHWMPLPEPPK